MKIQAMELVHQAQRMWAEDWKYVWGGASVNKIDCSGVLVYVYKQHGKQIYHGSNRIARVNVERLIPIGEAIAGGLIVPGMAAFRSRVPGDGKYSLDSKYKEGGKYYNGDETAYYHVGVVDEDTGYVLNAAGTRDNFERDPITKGWSHVARLTDVDYETPYEEDAAMIDVHEVIRKGAKGPAVVRMQGLLRKQGENIDADGKFGAKTEAALKNFQRRADLDDDGVCGPMTWNALQEDVDDVEMQPEAPKTWEQMNTDEKLELLHRWYLSMTGGGVSNGS